MHPVPQVLIRDLDSVVLDKLKARARRNGRSLEAELRLILARAAEGGWPERVDWGAVRAEVERVRARFAGRTFSDSTELIREDRDHAH